MPRRVRCLGILLLALLLCLPGSWVRADSMPAPYAKIPGSPLERQILGAARVYLEKALGDGSGSAQRVPWPGTRTGVFLTLMQGRSVRACAGTFHPLEETLSEALERTAGQVVSMDTRRDPILPGELEALDLVVSFVGEPEPCPDPFRIDFRREGLKALVHGEERVLLPGEARTLEYGIRYVLGILRPGSAYFERFRVVTLDERTWGNVK